MPVSKYHTALKIPVWFITLVLFFSPLLLVSQSPVTQNYTQADGLPENTVFAMEEDPNGFLWVATEAGLARFDGSKFVSFGTEEGLEDKEIIKLFKDSRGRIWYSTISGYYGFIENGKVFPSSELPYRKKKFLTFWYDMNEDFYGRLWFAAGSDGIWVLENNEFRCVRKDEMSYSLVMRDGHLLYFMGMDFLGHNFKISVYNTRENCDERTECYVRADVLSGKYPIYGAIRFDSLMIAGGGNFSIFLSSIRSVLNRNTSHCEIGLEHVVSISRYGNDCFAGQRKGGILHFTFDTLSNTVPVTRKYLQGLSVSRILMNFQGDLWVSTLEKGIFRLDWGTRKQLSEFKSEGWGEITRIRAINDSLILFSDNQGSLYEIRNDLVKRRFHVTNPLGGIDDFATTPDKILIAFEGSYLGVIPFPWSPGGETELNLDSISKRQLLLNPALRNNAPAYITLIPHKTPGCFTYWAPAIKTINVISETSFVIGTNRGIFRGEIISPERDGQVISFSFTTDHSRVFASAVSGDSVIWYSSANGLYSLRTKEESRLSKPEYRVNKKITSIVPLSPELLLLGTDGAGLILAHGGKTKRISAESGITAREITDVYRDRNNRIWVSTPAGLYAGVFDSLCPDQISFRFLRSIPSDPGSRKQNLSNAESKLWFSESDKLRTLSIDSILPVSRPFPVFIERITLGDSAMPARQDSSFQTYNTRIGFSFIAVDYHSDGAITYEYHLTGSGQDSSWRSTRYPEITYAALAPGSYTFEVRAVALDGHRSSNRAAYAFTVLPPWYTTWTFRIAAGILLLCIITAIFYTRLRVVRRRNEMELRVLESEQKALRSQMNPHFIFNSLNSIQRFLANNNPNESIRYLTKFGRLIRSILDHSRESAIPVAEELNALRLYMELEALRTGNKFDVEIAVDESLDQLSDRLPPLLLQPYVENAIWHGIMAKEGRGKITISLLNRGDAINCRIEDDGIGREKAREFRGQNPTHRKSHGMNITAERIALLNRDKPRAITVQITDLRHGDGTAAGTRVEMEIPKNF